MILGLSLALGGLVVLTIASDQFVKGAARLAVIMRIAPVVVGAVVIGFGTSVPEFVVSGLAAADGNLDIGVGNIIGSNVANISVVLAAGAFVAVIPVTSATLRRQAPLSVLSVVVFALFVQNGLTRFEGVVLSVLLVVVLALVLRSARRDDAESDGEVDELIGDEALHRGREIVRTALGLIVVAGSAWVLVDGAERVAEELNLTGGFVGFTLVAMGTSAPELVTALAAARQGQTELLVGNLLGSNVFNSLAVGGVVALVGPGTVVDTRLATRGSALMVVVVVMSWLMMIGGKRVNRREGLVLAAMWVVCIALLSGSDASLEALSFRG